MAKQNLRQVIGNGANSGEEHPDYIEFLPDWKLVRDCMAGERRIKSKRTEYLPQPAGMQGEYASAYDSYLERAHFPLIASYALAGALGVIITKLPEFNVPKELEYIKKEATKNGTTIYQLFLDTIIEILQTGKCPISVDIVSEFNQFKFVKYNAESFINWQEEVINSEKNLKLAVLEEKIPIGDDAFSHATETVRRVLYIDESGKYTSRVFGEEGENLRLRRQPNFKGKYIDQIPLFVAGSINNSVDPQPIPMLPVAYCSVQIYRKEADLANSEFLSCNPTLVLTGASDDDNLPNVVGSSVMIVLPDPQSRVFYTKTDTDALTYVKEHIKDLYEEAIRHGVSILDARKGIESAEALRIRQSTQSASIYSIYLSALNAIEQGILLMCDWGGFDKEKVSVDAPAALTYGIPDSKVIQSVTAGISGEVIPLPVMHRYLISSGLLDPQVSLQDYIKQLNEYKQDIPALNKSKPVIANSPKSGTKDENPLGN